MQKTVIGVAALGVSACGVQTEERVDVSVEMQEVEVVGGESVVFELDTTCTNEIFVTPMPEESIQLTHRLGQSLAGGVEWQEATRIEAAPGETPDFARATRIELEEGASLVELTNDDREATSIMVSEPQCVPMSKLEREDLGVSHGEMGDAPEAYGYMCGDWYTQYDYFYETCWSCGTSCHPGKKKWERFRQCRDCWDGTECGSWSSWQYLGCAYGWGCGGGCI